jgi:hypothetical protein
MNAILIKSVVPDAEGGLIEKGSFPSMHSQTATADLNLIVTSRQSMASPGLKRDRRLFGENFAGVTILHLGAMAAQTSIKPSIPMLDFMPPSRSSEAGSLA